MFMKPMNLDDNLLRHIALQDGAQNPDALGVEIELEGSNIMHAPKDVMVYWTPHMDNSLRTLNPGDQAIEYIFTRPFSEKQATDAIHKMCEYLNSEGVRVYDSYRTSIHVHVNYALEKFRTIYNAMTLSLILDELLTSQNGDHRIGNNFCLRAKDALGQVVNLCQSIEASNAFFGITQNDRYSSINFASLMKFGTIEYRSLECTTHEGRIMHWIGTLMQIKKAAQAYKNPVEIISQFSKLGPQEFLKNVLGPFAMKYQTVEGANEMLRDGMRIAQDLAYCSAWSEKVTPTK